MQERFVVEANRRVVGIAVRGPGGYKFFSSEPAYFSLEGRTFPRSRALAQSVARITRKLHRSQGGHKAGGNPPEKLTLQ